MAIQYSLRHVPTDSGDAMYTFKTFLKSLGWTVPRSSDGLTYFPTSDGITGNGTGANGIKNSKAWFVLRQPAIASGSYTTPTTPVSVAVREFLIQRDTANADTTWKIRYSRNIPFGDGTIVAVAGSVLNDATDFFTINDGSTTKVYEFDSNSSITAGHIRVPFTNTDSAATVASSIVTAINGGGQSITAYVGVAGLSTEVTILKSGGITSITENVSNAGFTVSQPTATVTPSASSAGTVLGGGTDAAPTDTTLFPTAGTYTWQIVAHDATPFGFICYGWVGNTGTGPAFMYDPMIDGTFVPGHPPSGDDDPYVIYAGYSASTIAGGTWSPDGTHGISAAYNATSPGGSCGYAHTGLTTQVFGSVTACWPAGDVTGSSALSDALPVGTNNGSASGISPGMNPFNGKDCLVDIPYVRSSSQFKGWSTFVKWNTSAIRSSGQIETDDVGTRARVSVAIISFPWDGGGS